MRSLLLSITAVTFLALSCSTVCTAQKEVKPSEADKAHAKALANQAMLLSVVKPDSILTAIHMLDIATTIHPAFDGAYSNKISLLGMLGGSSRECLQLPTHL